MKYLKSFVIAISIGLLIPLSQVHADEGMMGHGMMEGHKMEGYKGKEGKHDRPFMRHEPRKGHKMPHIFRREFLTSELIKALGLDEEQVEKIKGIESNYLKTQIRFEADIKIGELELRELITAKEIDLNKVKEKTETIGSLRSDLRFFRYKTMEDVKQILRDDQKEQFKKLFSRYLKKGFYKRSFGHSDDLKGGY